MLDLFLYFDKMKNLTKAFLLKLDVMLRVRAPRVHAPSSSTKIMNQI